MIQNSTHQHTEGSDLSEASVKWEQVYLIMCLIHLLRRVICKSGVGLPRLNFNGTPSEYNYLIKSAFNLFNSMESSVAIYEAGFQHNSVLTFTYCDTESSKRMA